MTSKLCAGCCLEADTSQHRYILPAVPGSCALHVHFCQTPPLSSHSQLVSADGIACTSAQCRLTGLGLFCNLALTASWFQALQCPCSFPYSPQHIMFLGPLTLISCPSDTLQPSQEAHFKGMRSAVPGQHWALGLTLTLSLQIGIRHCAGVG